MHKEAARMPVDEIGLTFVRLGLSLGKHFPGYVDAYYGPGEIAQAVNDEPKTSLSDLEALANGLAKTVADDSSLLAARRDYLLGEIAAILTTLQILQGQPLHFVEEVRRLYGVTPAWVEESTFAEAHRALSEILPGVEPLSDRVKAFREKMEVPASVAEPIIRRLGADFQERVRSRLPVPSAEDCEFALVRDKSWAAYNWYLGDSHSRIEINEDRPLRIGGLPNLVAHEAYPGHHTEHAVKEDALYRKEGRLEHAIILMNTPSALVSEGIAENGLETIASPEEVIAIYRDVLAVAGLPVEDAPRIHQFMLASRGLSRVLGNQLLLLHGQGSPEEEVIAYGMRYALTTEDHERQLMRFRKDPLSRSYGFNYTFGHDIVEAFLSASTDRLGAFAHLLQSPMTPGQIASLAIQ
jgi:hypothetical protein